MKETEYKSALTLSSLCTRGANLTKHEPRGLPVLGVPSGCTKATRLSKNKMSVACPKISLSRFSLFGVGKRKTTSERHSIACSSQGVILE